MAIVICALFVGLVLFLSFYLARKTKSASGYFAAGGTIHWSVNGISFAGDYLSAASFLGICGLISTVGYDGFLYSIGYLAGWIVALFVVAEPMKRLGKYTFADALDSSFNSKGIQFAAALSTLVVSICYLIPQMVGAGVLATPLLGLPHWAGVIMVGAIVIIIVTTAGMTSTTYVQFLKGGLLIIFSVVLVACVCMRGLTTTPDRVAPNTDRLPFYEYQKLTATERNGKLIPTDSSYSVSGTYADGTIVKLRKDGQDILFSKRAEDGALVLRETQWKSEKTDGSLWVNGAPASAENKLRPVGHLERIQGKTGAEGTTGPVSPFKLLAILGDKDTTAVRWKKVAFSDGEDSVTAYCQTPTPGNQVLRPGLKFKVEGSGMDRLNFVSLMLALFCGTAALPHILIRYYTVPSPACARKSTIVAIAAIGFFYILTLFMGLGAMSSGVLNLESDNMSAPLLANSYGTFLFAIISAIAFATILGTVSGLIVAASGAVAHDIIDRLFGMELVDHHKVFAGKATAVAVGVIAIILGIIFKGMNVSFLVGWAFAVAASASLPAIVMLLFWKKTTAKGIVASILVGMSVALGIILLSPSMYEKYGLAPADALIPLDNPGIISIPISFVTLVIVSLLTQNRNTKTA
jgi:cation/acetate symporter